MKEMIMTPSEFSNFLSELKHLTDKQSSVVQKILTDKDPVRQIIQSLEQRLIDKPECPHCHSRVIKRHGKAGDMQRYRCKNCLKTFMATTHTPLSGLHYKEKWLAYLGTMVQSMVLRQAAKECDIDWKTAFRWRHRFLQLPAQLKARLLEGIVEADETFFAYSEKGNKQLSRKARKRGKQVGKQGRSKKDWVPVLTARDRGTHTFECKRLMSSVLDLF
jgi:transposase-like protein